MTRKDFTWLFTFPHLSFAEKVELYLNFHRIFRIEPAADGQQ